MVEDARFEDGAERSLRLRAEDAEDLGVVAALIQDAVLASSDMKWERDRRRFACLLNRFRWEDGDKNDRPAERVRTLLAIDDVRRVQSQGIRPDDEAVLSILTLVFQPGEDGMGRIELTFAGDGALAFEVEAVNITLQDVTQPYLAPSGKTPKHPE